MEKNARHNPINNAKSAAANKTRWDPAWADALGLAPEQQRALAAHLVEQLERASQKPKHMAHMKCLDPQDLSTFTMTNMQGFTASALAFAVGVQELRKDDTTSKSGGSMTVEQASLHIVRRLNPGSLKTGDGGVRGPARVALYAHAAKKTVGKRETVREPCASLPCLHASNRPLPAVSR